jgi:hypothetical protein
MPHPTRDLSDFEVDERAASALALLNDPHILESFTALREMYINILENSPIGSDEAVTAHTSLKVLQDFRASVESMVTDSKMRKKYSGKVKNG